MYLAPIVAACLELDSGVEPRDVLCELNVNEFAEEERNIDAIEVREYTEADIAQCLKLVRRLWPEIVSAAKERHQSESKQSHWPSSTAPWLR